MLLLRSLYRLATLPLSLAVVPLFLLRERGRARLFERYGSWGDIAERAAGRELIWFHGASVGEVNGLLPIMREVRLRYPHLVQLLTSTSVTGLARAEDSVEFVRLLPFDHPLWIRRALRGLNVRAFAFGETEIWPALLESLVDSKIPICMVNGVLSDYSWRRYQALKPLLCGLVSRFRLGLAADEDSLRRLIELGANPDRVFLCGNAKYDSTPSVTKPEESRELRRRFFRSDSPVFVAASLRPGEEEVVFESLRKYRVAESSLCVVIAPRHKEKFDYFAQKLTAYSLPFRRFSEIESGSAGEPQAGLEIVLLDAYGVLEPVYSFSDLVFVGGTLVDWGGHNPLEAAAYGAALAFGPFTQKIFPIVRRLFEVEAAVEVRSPSELNAALELLEDTKRVHEMGQRARAVWQEMSGSSERIVAKLAEVLESKR